MARNARAFHETHDFHDALLVVCVAEIETNDD
jgi:hypothetical protein